MAFNNIQIGVPGAPHNGLPGVPGTPGGPPLPQGGRVQPLPEGTPAPAAPPAPAPVPFQPQVSYQGPMQGAFPGPMPNYQAPGEVAGQGNPMLSALHRGPAPYYP